MSLPPRRSSLSSRHRFLGSDLEDHWNQMAIPQRYATDPYDEVFAVRERAGLFDMSSLRMVRVTGPDAKDLLNRLLTLNIADANPGDARPSYVLNGIGGIVDDVVVYVDSNNSFRISQSYGAFEEAATLLVEEYDVHVASDDDVHIVSLQGPAALGVLLPHAGLNLSRLDVLRHEQTTLFGHNVSLARVSFTGERGYQIFCSKHDAPAIWDGILRHGQVVGVMPVSWSGLHILRVESGLLFHAELMSMDDITPWEVRADRLVDLRKPTFRGKQALMARKGAERCLTLGVEVEAAHPVMPGSKVRKGVIGIGRITSSAFSRVLMKSLALVQLEPAYADLGARVEIDDGGALLDATVVRTPFYDPLGLKILSTVDRLTA